MRGTKSFILTRTVMLVAAAACAAESPEAPAKAAPTSAASAASASMHEMEAPNAPTTSPSPTVDHDLKVLKKMTTPYQDLAVAKAAGWKDLVTDCMADPQLGGMGFHFADVARFDTTLDANRPEILVYAPTRQGGFHLSAVEYAVPVAAWTKADPPMLFGIPFHVNQQFGLWVLHAWVWRDNPSGVFADWNPVVSCTPK